ncbi:serine threonine- phosphatase 6 regulatory ankyrin repeat subunit B-like [Brachionus plicatilis]|uniref:Serine threonine-phosphatase 6 regulatory ankyrin repeat subunit B-like n=1 Tax=Brachionus plicatilis TaxID=10195 RepID=A0A3M7PB13_BRAPC|nr:serine threonine- phosphatase 6 regulatory ankyrin repeat subunit B-like [Brachionus plicatilis]
MYVNRKCPERPLLINFRKSMKILKEKLYHFPKLSELSDTRVLCGFINSFIPNLFPTEILMNDRWCINLVLRSIDKILMCESTMDSKDLVEAETQSVCAFFCYLFMMFYKFKQCRIIVNRYKELKTNIKKLEKECDSKLLNSSQKENNEQTLFEYKSEMESIKKNFDLKYFFKWIDKVQLVKETNLNLIKFDWFVLEEDVTSSNLCYNHAINLSLTNGLGFYKLDSKELISRNRKIIIRQKTSGKFLNTFADDSTTVIRQILRLPNFDPIDIDPKSFPNFDIFVECLSNNKILKKKMTFLYQVFPSDITFYHNFLLKSCLEKKFNKNTQNSALHICASHGYFRILLYLLENYANVNIQNKEGNTPLMLASENFHRDCAKLLIEFGADVNILNNRALTALNFTSNIEYNLYIEVLNQNDEKINRIKKT